MKLDRHKIELTMSERRLTRTELATRGGISRQTVSTALTRGTCSTITAGKLAKGLGCTVQEITKEE